MNHLFGAHYDIFKNELSFCIDHLKKCGGNFMQINTNTKLIKTFEKLQDKNINIVIHSHYFVNIANNTKLAIASLINDVYISEKIGAYGVVIHTGKSVDLDINKAKKNMFNVLLTVAHRTINFKTKLILETSSGQGSETCSILEEFTEFFNKLKKSKYSNRFSICIDTCHIFSAGYDISEKKEFDNYLSYIDDTIGKDNISLIHLNNSKNILGSNIDRHDNIEIGKIDPDSLKYIFEIFKNRNVPIILETPDRLKSLEKEIKFLN